MGALIAFDKTTMNWLNEASARKSDLYEDSVVFSSGYEDPTYMTFRIEFGGWGASTINKESFRQMQKTNSMSSSNIRKIYSFNYDDYPQGLLDLNFAENTIKSQPFYAFNEQGTYNAYNYLLQRNEDTRAAYLQTFIEGIYEIQRQYPYLFKEISGLDSLSEFDSKRGTRLGTDVTITLKCIEGLSRKIYTLMQCYAKAAWDAEYQRWILPENYRQFKMIIYVFERRVFHSTRQIQAAQNPDGASGTKPKQNFGQQVLNFILSGTGDSPYGPVSGPPQPMALHSVNSLLPVMAYECNLCEFAINTFGSPDSLMASWDDSNMQDASISIKVKNVRTYYKNGLLNQQLSDMVIGDLAAAVERVTFYGGNSQYIVNYLDRNTVFGDDIGPEIRPGFGGGGAGSGDPNNLHAAFDSMVSNWKSLLGKEGSSSGGSSSQPQGFYESQMMASLKSHDLTGYRNINWWYNATINPGPLSGSIWKKIWTVITAGTQHIRVAPGYQNAVSGVYYNILDYIDYNNNLAGAYLSYATRDNNMNRTDRAAIAAGGYVDKFKWYSTAMRDDKMSEEERKQETNRMDTKDPDSYMWDYEPVDTENMDSLVDEHKKLLEDFYDQGAHIGDPAVEMTKPSDGYEYDAPDKLHNEIEDTDLPENDNMTGGLEYPEYVYPNSQLETVTDGVDLPDIPIQETISNGVNLPITAITSKYEFPEYVYPNSQMETVNAGPYDPKLLGGEIAPVEGFEHENPKFELDEISGGIEVVDKLGETGLLTAVDRPELVLSKEGNIVLDLEVARDIISSATAVSDIDGFSEFDEAFKDAEYRLTDMIKESSSMEHVTVTGDLAGATTAEQMMAEIALNTQKVKEEAATRIAEMQSMLRQESQNVLSSSDRLVVSKAMDKANLGKEFIEVPQAVINQLEDNIALFSIPRPALGQMSMQTMVGIERGLEKALMNTSALVEVLHMTDDRSLATDLDGGPDTSRMNEGSVERTTSSGKPLIG